MEVIGCKSKLSEDSIYSGNRSAAGRSSDVLGGMYMCGPMLAFGSILSAMNEPRVCRTAS